MNVYDFDGTIYRGDSSIDFFLFCARRKPKIFLLVPRIAASFALRLVRKASTEEVKSVFFSFVRMVPDIDPFVDAFWKSHSRKIMGWYRAQKQSSDVLISASPEFLLGKISGMLGVRLIATDVCKNTGAVRGKNCRGEEKLVGSVPNSARIVQSNSFIPIQNQTLRSPAQPRTHGCAGTETKRHGATDFVCRFRHSDCRAEHGGIPTVPECIQRFRFFRDCMDFCRHIRVLHEQIFCVPLNEKHGGQNRAGSSILSFGADFFRSGGTVWREKPLQRVALLTEFRSQAVRLFCEFF